MKHLLTLVCAVVSSLVINSAVLLSSVQAQSLPPPTLAANNWLLLDMTSNQVIAAQEADARVEPASLTKIMTAY